MFPCWIFVCCSKSMPIVKCIGFSGHHLGIAVDIAAYALGAEWIERHFTKDRTWKGTDHAASLEAAGLSKLVRDLNATYTSLSHKVTDILDLEKEQRAKLKWGQYNKSVLTNQKWLKIERVQGDIRTN